MAKRGYKLQEFVAHSGSVNCLKIGKKNFRQFVTGGDDQVVNLWSIGNPEPVTSLCGHTSPVESVAFDSAEVLVVAGASSGAIKLWDLEEKKMVRTLSGHRSYCTAAEFHPFGEFFASGSMDTNLKMWDIRKKGCIHTYKGHTRGISTIRFSPDGRWVVSGGFDNVIKIWDLTAGKLLHDFKHHEGHIRSIDFHPLEFLLATGSADKTVKFWDLETFEMIGSARREVSENSPLVESAGVRSITFHPDGRTLFCGLDDSLKVYSWEPVICHDSVDMGWSTLGDLCVHDGKLLGGAYFQNSVGVWVADNSFIEPYGSVDLPDHNSHPEQKHELREDVQGVSDCQWKSNSSIYRTSDVDSNDIKNIYVDSCNPVASTNSGSLDSPNNVIISEKKDSINQSSQKKRSAVSIPAKTNVSAGAKSVTVPTIVPRDIPEIKDLTISIGESFVSSRASVGMVKPSHVRRLSITKSEIDNRLTSPDPLSLGNMTSTVDPKKDQNLINRLAATSIAMESTGEKDPSIRNVEESDKASTLTRPPSRENGEKSQDFKQGMAPVRVVNGVAVVRGRTRSLVERFEKKEPLDITEAHLSDRDPDSTTIAAKTSPTEPDRALNPTNEAAQTSLLVPDKAPQPTAATVRASSPVADEKCHTTTEAVKTSLPVADGDCHPTNEAAKTSLPVADEDCHPTTETVKTSPPVGRHPTIEAAKASLPGPDRSRHPTSEGAKMCTSVPDRGRNPTTEAAKITPVPDRGRHLRTGAAKTSMSVGDRGRYPTTEAASGRTSLLVSDRFRRSTTEATSARTSLPVSDRFRHSTTETASSRTSLLVSDRFRHPTTEASRTSLLISDRFRHPTTEAAKTSLQVSERVRHPTTDAARTSVLTERGQHPAAEVAKTSLLVPERDRYPTTEPATRSTPVPDKTPHPRTDTSETFPQNDSQLSAGRQDPDLDDDQIIEALMENHDVLLSTFRSRLTKLQMVRHFWEKKDVKGAINAMKRLPDYSLQADVVSVLVERVEIISLDLFSCLLPVLLGLLDSKVERHVSVSLEMLLKLTAAFGPLVRSTAAAPRLIGVDLHAEERIAICKQCSAHLQNVQNIIPTLIQRGGVVTRCALELNLVLQQS